jgi:hypothetical protein
MPVSGSSEIVPNPALSTEVPLYQTRTLSKSETPCFNFNKPHNLCRMPSCGFAHFCALCLSVNHGWSNCNSRFFCLDLAKDRCGRGDACDDRHWCLPCHALHSPTHDRCKLFRGRIDEPNFPFSYCYEWNAHGECIDARCPFRHECVCCGNQKHGSTDCVHSLVVLINTSWDGALVDNWCYRK